MVWTEIGFHGESNVAFPSVRMSLLIYKDVLKENIWPLLRILADISACPSARQTIFGKGFFFLNVVIVIP